MKELLGIIPIAIGAVIIFTDLPPSITIPAGIIALTCGGLALKQALEPTQ